MWLLSTDRAELHYFARNFDATGGYAILSHTWGDSEQTFQDLLVITERCRGEALNPRDFASEKIRNCCLLAEQHGYRWLWIDSCCIDKTSSSELSEAINSMYQWYKEAEVCYVYLADVPEDDDLDAPESAFRTSRWHTRGWTLQELIAPAFLIFLSARWQELGNRAALAGLLQEITGVPFGVLTGEHMPAEYSISIRMFWASKRKTTRVEDEAYCLMGLFGISMPTNYGEGKQAFIRLQYEIMQHDSDMSLFAFGPCVNQDDTSLTFHAQNQVNHPWQYLLADSPREFDYGFGYIPDLGMNANQQYPPPLDSAETGPFDVVELPRATVTSYGIKLRLPVYTADGTTIAVVLCTNHNRHFGLFLTPDSGRKDPKRPRYFTGCVYQRPSTTGSATYVARIADLGYNLYNLTFNGKPVRASWQTIYVVPTASPGRSTAPNLILNCNPTSRFRVPQWLISHFTTLQFEVDQVQNTDTLQVVRILHRSNARIFVSLGSCTEHQEHNLDKPSALWAKVNVLSLFDMDTFTHDCAEDHLDSESWAARSKVFGDADRMVRLSFTPSSRRSENVVIIHLELGGRVFEEMLQEAAVSFPSLAALEIDTLRPTPSDAATSIQPRTLVHIESPSPRSPSSSPTREPHARPSSFPHRSHVTPSDPITRTQPRALARIASPFSSSHSTRQPRARPSTFSHTSRRTPREVIALSAPRFPPQPPSIASPTPSSNSTWKPQDPSFPFPPPVTNHRLGIRAVQGKIGDGHVSCPGPPSAARVTPTRMFYSDGAHRNLWRGGRGEGTLNGFPWPSAGRPPMGPWSSSHPPTPPPGNLPNPQSFFSLCLLVVHWMLGGLEAVVGTRSVPLEDTE